MKKIFFYFLIVVLSVSIYADKKVLISDLPNSIVDFMKNYFPESNLDYAEYDEGEYEICFSDMIDNKLIKGEAQFSKRGDWEKIDFYNIPKNLLPENVIAILQENFANQEIISLEHKRDEYEITFTDSTEIEISADGKILEIDKDHYHKKIKDKDDRKYFRDSEEEFH